MLMELLPDDVKKQIWNFLNAKGLARWSLTARGNIIPETQWQRCVRERFEPGFGPYSLRPKSCGASTWKRAFRELSRRMTAPRTFLTQRHQKVAAKGCCGEIAGWITVSHRSDCRVQERREGNNPQSIITLNVIIQNIGSAYCAVQPNKLLVLWLCSRQYQPFAQDKPVCTNADSEDDFDSCLETRSASVLDHSLLARSRGGEEKNDLVTLQQKEIMFHYEWLAFQIQVQCPGCTYEADFLERAVSCEIPYMEVSGDQPGYERKGLLNLAFLSTDQLQSWYMTLPGGCVTLNTERLLL